MNLITLTPRLAFAVAAVMMLSTTQATAQRAPRPVSPEIGPNNTVTLRLNAPNAEQVELTGSASRFVTSTTKADNGLWTITLSNVEPEVYEYGFNVDGTYMTDPLNRNLKEERTLKSLLIVPNNPPQTPDVQDVPHGSIHVHHYNSKTLGGVDRRFHVYTPAGYENSNETYPVLYLLHGSGDNDSVWASTGRAHVIADNLIANQQAKPMIIVMPDGHPAYAIANPNDRQRNANAFSDDVLNEIMPAVNKTYRIKQGRDNHAVMGLSMGGGQTLQLALAENTPFAYIGAFSASVRGGDNPAQTYPALNNVANLNQNVKWFWIGIGSNDFLFDRNNTFTDYLKQNNVTHTYHVTDDAHNWACWRRYLALTLPMLFQD